MLDQLPETAVKLSEGPDGEHWEDKANPLAHKEHFIFKCKHCGRITYAEDPNGHEPDCSHPWFRKLEDLGDLF